MTINIEGMINLQGQMEIGIYDLSRFAECRIILNRLFETMIQSWKR